MYAYICTYAYGVKPQIAVRSKIFFISIPKFLVLAWDKEAAVNFTDLSTGLAYYIRF